jgi:hypothetical protein
MKFVETSSRESTSAYEKILVQDSDSIGVFLNLTTPARPNTA